MHHQECLSSTSRMCVHGSQHQRNRIRKKSFKELQLRNVLHYRTSLREEKTLAVLIPPKNKIRLKKCHPAFEDLITLGSPLHCIYWSWQKSYLPELQVELPVGVTYTEHIQTTCGTTCRSHKKSYLSELPIRSIVKLPAELPAGAVWRATCRSCLIIICRSSVTRFLNYCEGLPQMRHQRNILKS